MTDYRVVYKGYEYSPLIFDDEDDHYHVTHFVRKLQTGENKAIAFSPYVRMSKIDFINYVDLDLFSDCPHKKITSSLLRALQKR